VGTEIIKELHSTKSAETRQKTTTNSEIQEITNVDIQELISYIEGWTPDTKKREETEYQQSNKSTQGSATSSEIQALAGKKMHIRRQTQEQQEMKEFKEDITKYINRVTRGKPCEGRTSTKAMMMGSDVWETKKNSQLQYGSSGE